MLRKTLGRLNTVIMLSLKIAGLAREKMNLMHQAFELTKISVHKGKCNREGIYTHR